jgi:hypothetical protein
MNEIYDSPNVMKDLLGHSHDIVFSEIKDAYNKQFELKESLDRKAQANIQVAGIVITLLFGFSAFILTVFGQSFGIKAHILELTIISMILNTVGVLLAVKTLKLKDFQFMFADLNDGKLTEYLQSSKFVTLNSLIADYHITNDHNIHENKKKAHLLRVSQETIFVGLLVIPIVAIAFILV